MNLLGILQEILACTGVQIARMQVQLARKKKETERKSKADG